MNDMQIERNKHHTHLSLFLNTVDKELPWLLKEDEEFNGNEGFTVGDYTSSSFGSFHPEAVRMVLQEDDYYLGYRANHFVLIFGQAEVLGGSHSWGDCVVCLANHKGGLCVSVFTFKDDETEVS